MRWARDSSATMGFVTRIHSIHSTRWTTLDTNGGWRTGLSTTLLLGVSLQLVTRHIDARRGTVKRNDTGQGKPMQRTQENNSCHQKLFWQVPISIATGAKTA